MNYEARAYFKLGADPWADRHVETSDALRARLLVGAAADAQAMVAIAGPRGSGKSHAVKRALGLRPDVPVVEPLRLDRERLHLGDIQDAIVRDLSEEAPKRSGEARSRQVRRILGTVPGRRPVLAIDDAHALHGATLKGLKRLRELSFRGRAPLIGVVLIGQSDPTAKTPEVALRSGGMRFRGLTSEEARSAILGALGAAVTDSAARAMADAGAARNWLDLQRLADACLAAAAAGNARAIAAGHVREALEGAAPRAAAPAPAPSVDGDAAVDSVLGRAKRAAKAVA